MSKFDPLTFINQLCALGERQLEGETQAAELIRTTLNQFQIKFQEQSFTVEIPRYTKATLTVDDQTVAVLPTGLISGQITKESKVLSSLISSQLNSDDNNLNYSSASSVISKNNYYFAPALAFNYKDLNIIQNARSIKGELVVQKETHSSVNFLIGNLDAPTNILFCHYDSWGPGAIDNASGTALLLQLIIEEPHRLENCLFVIAGNEEISYDYPIYWGHGYRVFEEKYLLQLEKANTILVIDCVGHAEPILTADPHTITLGFPLKNAERLSNKTKMLYADFDKLMAVYHSEIDLPTGIIPSQLQAAYKIMLQLL